MKRAAQLCRARRAFQLPVSNPFHCSLMTGASEKFFDDMTSKNFKFITPSVPVMCNTYARPIEDFENMTHLLAEHVRKPVLWHQSLELLSELCLVEIGGSSLAALAKRDGHAAFGIDSKDCLEALYG